MRSFRLWTIFYVFALLAAALATFGLAGIPVSALVLGFWAWRFNRPKQPTTLSSILLITVGLGLLIVLLVPAVKSARQASLRVQCMNNLKQIQLALLNYESANGSMPPAYIADAQGKPMHSWRVLILPYLGETALYNRYNLSEPWNGPNNSKLAQYMPDTYRCPGQTDGKTSRTSETQYVAIVDPAAAWPGSTGRPIRQFSDGTSLTITVIEASGLGIQWMDPRDVSLDEAIELLTTKPRSGHAHVHDGFLTTTYYETSSRNAAFCDGHIMWMEQLRDPKFAKAILTAAGGEQISPQYEAPVATDSEPKFVEPKSTTDVKWGVVWGLTVFAILALLPAAWIGRESKKGEVTPVREDDREFADASSAI
jgi:hypothetical protein